MVQVQVTTVAMTVVVDDDLVEVEIVEMQQQRPINTVVVVAAVDY
jgi:hypothetical protein